MKNVFIRFYIIIAAVVLLAAACVIRLVDLQIVKGSEYAEINNERLVRAYSVAAPRGEILDNKGKPLVENRTGYSIQVQKVGLNDDDLNRILYSAAKLAAEYGAETESSFPIVKDEKGKSLTFDFTIEENGGTRPVEGVKYPEVTDKTDEKSADAKESEEKSDNADSEEKKAEKLEAWKKENKLASFSSAEEILGFYEKKYGVSSEYDSDAALAITAIRYAMDKANFSEKNPYKLCRDIDMTVVQQIKEQYSDFPGIDVIIEPFRSFIKGTFAAHILGRTGRIYAEEYAEMKNDGYGINDMIGKDGLEKVLEKYLKGKDGYKSVEMNRGGGVTQILQDKEPKSGNYAKLTLDRDLQEATENALKEKISQAVGTGAGAAIAVNPKTGGVLAMASYPTYDLSTFNENYDKLIKSKGKPLINRVLNGTYSPGSTFKPLTSVAALESGTITPDTYITDLGKYTYYPSYQPTCLVYSSSGATHGTINVSQAIGVSCNYFFYDVGRRMGIETIDKYAENFGLGQTTGIELPESTGILASPSNRERAGGTWYPGDVLQAAIGQSDNLFTPAQLASYVCTLLNKGKRYSLHLVDEIVDYDTKEVVYKKEPKLLADNPISDSTYNAVTDGMRRVVTSGTASAAFASSKYKAAGKTGTAEVPDGADNVLFVGFAPYDDPEIVVAVIIEHGATSKFSAGIAREIFDAYMQIKEGKYKSALDKSDDENVDSSDGDKIITKPRSAQKSSDSNSKGAASDKKSDSAKARSGSNTKASDKTETENSGRPPENVQKSNNNSEGEGTL